MALIAGWAKPLEEAAVWTGFILTTIMLPPLIPVIAEIAPRRPGVTLRSHLRALGLDLRLALIQSGLMIVFLAHQAWLMGDAIVRTLARLTVTRRNLLEWVPAAHAAFGPRPRAPGFYQSFGCAASAVGQKATSAGDRIRSTLLPTADFEHARTDVR